MQKSNLIPFVSKNLHILFVGLNPAKGSSENHHYFSVNQAFWSQLYNAGLITEIVDKSNADEKVFGTNKINFNRWSYGITDLVIEIADSNSRNIESKESDCRRLVNVITEYSPKVAILMHKKVTRAFLTYLGEPVVAANHGQIGKIVDGCPTMFYSIGFPHGNNISSRDKVEKYIEVKNYLLMLE